MKPAFTGDWPIPPRIVLPGLRAKVILDPSMSIDGMWVYDYDTEKGVNRAAFRVNSSRPIEVQRYTLLHELVHGVHDTIDVMLEMFPEYVKTKHMAGIKKEGIPLG